MALAVLGRNFSSLLRKETLSKDSKVEKAVLLGSLGKYVPGRWSWWEAWNVLEQPGGRGAGAEQAGGRRPRA